MAEGNAAISYEVLEHRSELLLEEWAECQRREPSAWVQGYPSMSVEARMMDDWGRRSDKGRREAWQRNVRRALTDGKAHNVVMLAPDRADRQTRVRVVKRGDDWPEHIVALDWVIARMPRLLVRVVVTYYIAGHSIRSGASRLGIGRGEMSTQLDRARWYIAGQLVLLD